MSKVTYKVGDLFGNGHDYIGQGVNIKGLMGAGIAVLFKRDNPRMYAKYKAACDAGELLAGDSLTLPSDDHTYTVVNLASQDLPGANARLEWLQRSIESFIQKNYSGSSLDLAIPLIGCGIGGLKWSDVKPLLENLAETFENRVSLTVYSLIPFEDIE